MCKVVLTQMNEINQVRQSYEAQQQATYGGYADFGSRKGRGPACGEDLQTLHMPPAPKVMPVLS